VPGETVKGSLFQIGAGGKGFNQCVAAKKVGGNVVMITKIGRDPFGTIAIDMMKSLDMDISHILYSEDTSTGAALIMVDENTSQNEIVVIPGSCETITSEEVQKNAAVIRESEYLLVQLEINLDALKEAILIAHEAGVKVVLNPAPMQELEDELLRMVDIITPNEVEAESLTGICIDSEAAAEAAAKQFFQKGVKQVVITLGGRGVFVATREKHVMFPPFKVEVQDTTGAGDAFNGGFVAALAEGQDIWEAAKFASAVAGMSVTRRGTSAAMPTRAEVEQLLKQ
ncbi:MAG: ribokinase, partial [Hungatella sp.]